MQTEDQLREDPVPTTTAQRVHAHVSGKVQGVWFRASTQDRARELGLTGWVRNLYDGRVELVAEGPREDLDALVDWLHRGPELARVVQVDTDWGEATGEHDDFAVADSIR